MKEMIKKAMKSAANYNKRLQREKQEERETFFDMQTMVIRLIWLKHSALFIFNVL